MNTPPICILRATELCLSQKKEKASFAPLCMPQKAEPYLKFTQKMPFMQEKLLFSCMKTEVFLASGPYFYNRTLLF